MRLLVVSVVDDPFDPPGSGRFGGGHQIILDLVRHLVRQGDDVTLVTRLNDERKPEFQDVCSSLRIHRLPAGPAAEIPAAATADFLPDLSQALFSRLEGAGFDAVHSQYWVSGLLAQEWTSRFGGIHVHVPISYGRRQGFEAADTLAARRDEAELAIFQKADWIVVASPAERDTLHHLYPEVVSTNVSVIPCGIDTDTFHPRPSSADHYLRRQARSLGEGS